MTKSLFELWVYLAETPLLGLTLTLVAYRGGDLLYRRARLNPLVNPVLIAVVVIALVLMGTGTDYETYFDGAKFVHFLLGTATVALAVPLYNNIHHLRRSAVALAVALLAGSLVAAVTAVGVAWALGASGTALASIAPKSVTAPIAMGISEKLHGVPSLTAVLVILTGILGAVSATWLLDLLRIRDWRARGLAIGLASHGIGTARAISVNQVAGAFASLAMGLNGVLTAILLPLLAALLL